MFIKRFNEEMAKSVAILKNFEENIGKQDDILAIHTVDVRQAHECIDRRTTRVEKLEDDNKELKDRVKSLERQVGEVPGGLLVTC